MNYLINFLLFILIYFAFFFRRWRKNSIKEFGLKTLMYIYIVMVFFVTLMPFPIPFAGSNNLFLETANFIPFRDVIMGYDGAVREIILNVIMMMPFGFLYPIIRKKGFIMTIAFSFFFSLFIECVQLLSAWWGSLYSRSFDVTDLITNTSGGFLGYLIYYILKSLIRKVLD